MVNHNVNSVTKSNTFKFKSLDECLNTSYTMRTCLKGQYKKNERQCTKSTKLVPISVVELKIKQENNDYIFSKHSSTLTPAQHWSANQQLDI